MGKTVVLVSCVKSKRSQPSNVRDLYISTLFKGASAYAEVIGDRWFILSAKYGLLDPDQVIAPYEKTLNKMPVAERRAWAKEVFADLEPTVKPGDDVVFLAGARYRENLIDPLEQIGCSVSVPMEGLPFGKQLTWLKKQTNSSIKPPARTRSKADTPNVRKQEEAISLVDQIRKYAISNFIQAARADGKSTVKITAKEIHTDLELKSRYPAVCGALDGEIFKEQAGVILRSRSGPQHSSTASWIFEIA